MIAFCNQKVEMYSLVYPVGTVTGDLYDDYTHEFSSGSRDNGAERQKSMLANDDGDSTHMKCPLLHSFYFCFVFGI